MQRIPEPQLMNDPLQVLAYAGANFDNPHNAFVEKFQHIFSQETGRVLDLGCGPADISIRFAKRFTNCQIDGVDGASLMLEQAELAVTRAQLDHRIHLYEGLLPSVKLPHNSYDTIISNSLLHHLYQPEILWESIKQFGEPGSRVFIMDLLRPASVEMARQMTEIYTSDETEILQRDFFNSLCASFLLEEVTAQLREAELDHLRLEVISDRHFIVYGQLR